MEEKEKVLIPQETIADSKEKKRQHKTLRQLPLYRDLANLEYMVAKLYMKLPRKMTRYLDITLNRVSEAGTCVSMAECERDPQARASYLSTARAFAEKFYDSIIILQKLNLLDKQTAKGMKNLAKGVIAQTVAWRDYTNGEGAKSDVQ